MTLTLFHTSPAHLPTFEALRDQIAPDLPLEQRVEAAWLARARKRGGVSAGLAGEIAQAVRRATGPVLCTCTTIGEAAEAAGALRIDWPMMREAARLGGPILMAYCLESTWGPSLALLERALAAEGREATVHPMPLTQYWPLFESGAGEAFDAVIAGEIRQVLESPREVACVVLAQASMAGAAPRLADQPVPVLASPELAFRAALEAF
ncbi:MAG: hypothetical protein RIG84_08725 [Roseovarius sp.]